MKSARWSDTSYTLLYILATQTESQWALSKIVRVPASRNSPVHCTTFPVALAWIWKKRTIDVTVVFEGNIRPYTYSLKIAGSQEPMAIRAEPISRGQALEESGKETRTQASTGLDQNVL
uniref:Uncharacterized protein n=1 Tax=Coccidioides posadasii RMSCC 3488 TaxID=454284 RepID=A0A0J6IF94_COCPO|nr:hypothetical protein CPAG_06793 [Coccidioides posadasii RMSCC 3488]